MLSGPVVEGAIELAPVSECRTPPAAVVDEITLRSLPSWQRETDLLLPEERLSRLRVVRKIATGGMAEVYAAVDVESGAWRALKVASLAERNRYEDCHRNEIEALSAIDHPNILRLIDHGSERGLTYIVTELLEGQTLRRPSPIPRSRRGRGFPIRPPARFSALRVSRRRVHSPGRQARERIRHERRITQAARLRPGNAP